MCPKLLIKYITSNGGEYMYNSAKTQSGVTILTITCYGTGIHKYYEEAICNS
jgi:hypothetical protein